MPRPSFQIEMVEVSLKFTEMTFKFQKAYFTAFLILFAIEALIAIFLKDGFIRHSFGDYLVVMLLYCFFKSFIRGKSIPIALAVLVIAYIIEFLQLFNLLELLNLQNSSIAKVILGSTFHISDLVAYTLGVITLLIFEHTRLTNN